MSYTQLVEGQRYQIQAYLSQNLSQNRIAELLKVNPSTISRELKPMGNTAQKKPNGVPTAEEKLQLSFKY
jgi:IS30 family transposase